MRTTLIILISIIIAFILSLAIYEFSNQDKSCHISQFNLAVCLLFVVIFISVIITIVMINFRCKQDKEVIDLQSVTL